MGRHAAGESFLRGFLENTRGEDLWIQVDDPAHGTVFAEIAAGLGRREPLHAVQRHNLAELATPGLVFHPGPGIGEEALRRSLFGHRRWSLCGITHTTCSARVMDSIAALLTAPVQPWDAVICTSDAVRSSLNVVLEAQQASLRERLGCTRVTLPQLPVIPLGIHTEAFAFSPEDRDRARQALGIEPQTLVVTFMGRLAFHAKAHPLAMYLALERAARAAGVRVELLECGWHANEAIGDAFQQAAAWACPSIRVRQLDGRDPAQRQQAWASTDVFCSLADNIQETFGLTPLEAMAAGLPVVVSDWDGYRDTVRDGIDGFRVPTLLPPAGLGTDLAGRHALGIDSYDHYCGLSCAFTAVDVEAAAQAFSRLFGSPELRRSMGEAGRQRVRALFDWSRILPRYRELWAELRRIRQASPELPAASGRWPARLDPFEVFAGYPTATLSGDCRLALAAADLASAQVQLDGLLSLGMVRYALPLLPAREELVALLRIAAQGPCALDALLLPFPEPRRALLCRSLVWMLKLDLLRLVRAAS